MSEPIYRKNDGWYSEPSINKVQKKTKDAEMFRCPKCGMIVQMKHKVWLYSTRPATISVVAYPQHENCGVAMQPVEP